MTAPASQRVVRVMFYGWATIGIVFSAASLFARGGILDSTDAVNPATWIAGVLLIGAGPLAMIALARWGTIEALRVFAILYATVFILVQLVWPFSGVAGVALGLGGANAPTAQDLAVEKDVMMVTSAPDATSMDMDLGSGHVVVSDRMDAFALMGAAAPMPNKGTEYQVWLVMADGSKVAGPTFMPGEDGDYMTVVYADSDDVVAIAITCEPPGGSDEPTSDTVSVVEV